MEWNNWIDLSVHHRLATLLCKTREKNRHHFLVGAQIRMILPEPERTNHTYSRISVETKRNKTSENKSKENFSCNAIEKKPNTHLLTLSSPCVCACDFNLECTHPNIPVQQPLGCQTDVWRRVPTPRGNEGETIQYETGQLTRKQNQ